MKKQMLLALWLPLIAITLISGCKKTTNNMPYEVRTYNNGYQFGGIVNSDEFMPFTESTWFGIDPIEVFFRVGVNNTTNFQCNIRRLEYEGAFWKKWDEIELFIENFKGIGIYKLNSQTNFYGFTTTPKSYGGFSSETNYTGSKKYYITNSLADTGYINCKRWNSNTDYEFEFKYKCRKVYPNDSINPIQSFSGVLIKKP